MGQWSMECILGRRLGDSGCPWSPFFPSWMIFGCLFLCPLGIQILPGLPSLWLPVNCVALCLRCKESQLSALQCLGVGYGTVQVTSLLSNPDPCTSAEVAITEGLPVHCGSGYQACGEARHLRKKKSPRLREQHHEIISKKYHGRQRKECGKKTKFYILVPLMAYIFLFFEQDGQQILELCLDKIYNHTTNILFFFSQIKEKPSKCFYQENDMIRFTFQKDHPLMSAPAVSSRVHHPHLNAVSR